MSIRTWTLKTVVNVPFGTYPPYPTGPALVAHGGWNTSCTTGGDIDGVRVGAFKVITENPWTTERHELDGQIFPTSEEANRAKYEAGLIAYMVYDDTEWAAKYVPTSESLANKIAQKAAHVASPDHP